MKRREKISLVLSMADSDNLAGRLSAAVSRAISEALNAQDSSQSNQVRIDLIFASIYFHS